MFTLQIPSDGSSVPVKDFGQAAADSLKAASEPLPMPAAPFGPHSTAPVRIPLTEADAKRAKAGIAAAQALISAGEAGSENVFAIIGGADAGPGGILPSFTIGVHARPGPVIQQLPAVLPDPPRPNPYYTGPKPDEIAREAAATGKSLEETAKELGAATVTVVQHDAKTGTTTTVTKDTGYVRPAPISPEKANLPSQADLDKAAAGEKAKPGKAVTTTAIQKPARTSNAASAKAPSAAGASKANADAPQSNQQTAKPKAGAFAKQVAKDRAGK